MKVLQVTPTYWPAVRYGGPIRSARGLTAGLVKQGCDVEVFTTNIDGPDVVDAPRGKTVSLDGASIHYFPTGMGRRLYRSPEMASALRARIAEFDIVHIHAVYLWPGYAAARIALGTVIDYLGSHPQVEQVRFVLFDEEAFAVYQQVLMEEAPTRRPGPR